MKIKTQTNKLATNCIQPLAKHLLKLGKVNNNVSPPKKKNMYSLNSKDAKADPRFKTWFSE